MSAPTAMKTIPHGASANTPYPLARTFAPPPHCRRVHNTLPTLQDAIRLYSDHYNPLQAKWRRRRGRSRFTRSNAPQRLEAREWESCRTTDGMSRMGVMQDDRRDVEPLREVSTATKTNARPFRPCRESSTQRSRKRVTFVMRPATPCPVPSKKRQRFNPHPPAEHPPIRPHHKGLPPTIMLSYLFAAEK